MEHNMNDDEHPVSVDFPELFHYTNLSAFKKIYESKKFRATHYQDLNDTTEFTRFRHIVEKFIHPMIRERFKEKMKCNNEISTDVHKQGGIDTVIKKEAKWLIDLVHSHNFNENMYKETFVCSFCAHTQPYESTHGLLSQWRGYGANGGVAIVLKTSDIEKRMRYDYDKISQLQLMYVATVDYDSPDNDKIMKKFKKVFASFPEIIKIAYPDDESFKQKEMDLLFEEMHDHFVLGSTLVKHQAFHEENEIRIVVSPKTNYSYNRYDPNDSKEKKEIRYRQVGNREARYIELFGDDSLPINRIIIGPSRIQNANYQTVRDIIKNQNIEVIKSEIPFIS